MTARVWLLGLLLVAMLSGCVGDEAAPVEEGVVDPPNGRWSRVAPGTYSVQPGDYVFDGVSSRTLIKGGHDVRPVVSVMLASEVDGADIDLSYWLPDVPQGEEVPVIVQASPYFARTDVPSGSQRFGDWMVEEFVPHGYAYVQLAIRSTADSGGCDDFRGPNMSADLDQAMDWLAAQEWSNGNIALIGKSYPGSTPWYAAGTGNPHIRTIVPVSGSTNAWEVYNRNGTPEARAAAIVPNYGVAAATNDQRDPDHKVENFACTEVWEAWAYGVSSGATGERLPPEWWQARNSKPSVEANYDGSVLLVHGLQDWNVDPAVALPWVDHLQRSGLVVKQVLGQWEHDHPDQGNVEEAKRWDWAQLLLNWFDRELKGLDVDVGPPVQVQSNDMRWRDETAWPPHDARWEILNLGSHVLSSEETAAGSAMLLFGDDAPVPDVWPSDVLMPAGTPNTRFDFLLQSSSTDLRISGLPKVHVTVTPTGPSGYIGAFLYEWSPDGFKRLGWTGMNLRFADGTETPRDVVPGEKLFVKMELQPLDVVVPAGHPLVLRLSSATPADRVVPPHPYPVILHWGGDDTSVLKLPVIERGEEAFFEPPMPPE